MPSASLVSSAVAVKSGCRNMGIIMAEKSWKFPSFKAPKEKLEPSNFTLGGQNSLEVVEGRTASGQRLVAWSLCGS